MTSKKELKYFSCEQCEALFLALQTAANEMEQDIYTYLDETPKTSLVVELVNKLNEAGYKIVKEDSKESH